MLARKRPSQDDVSTKPVKRAAKPSSGKVDFAKLRRDLKAKFPKTIAHLAK